MKKKILVVDDEEVLRKILAIRLRDTNEYDVIEAQDGLMGLNLATVQKPDLIISDVYMDRMNGFMMLDALREQPDTANIPVIMMTAQAQRAGAWKSGGAVEYLDKGFAFEELLGVIKRVLNRS